MLNPSVIFLAVMSIVFILWAILMFRMLWAINRRAKQARDPLAGAAEEFKGNLAAFYGYFRDPVHRADNIRLVIVTVVLFAIQAVGFFILGGA